MSPAPRRAWPWALLALAVLALALHARVLAGEALVAWDLSAHDALWARPGVAAWNPTLQDSLVATWPGLLRFARDPSAAWDPLLGLGHPDGVADVPLASYPPAVAAHALLPPWLAQGLLALVHAWGVGAALYGHLRWRGLGPRAALVGGIAGELSTFLTTWLSFPLRVHALPWATLAVWAADAAGRDGRPRHAALAGLALGAAGLAGLVDQTVVLQFALAALVVLARGPTPRRLGLAALALAVGALVAAAQAVPLAAAAAEGHRERLPPAAWFEATARLGGRHLALLVLPDALGSPLRAGAGLLSLGPGPYANLAEVRLHLGLPALVLALAGVGRGTRGLAALALLAVAAAFPTPAAWLAYHLVPGFGTSTPARALVVLHLVAPLLVGHGFAALRRAPRRPRAAAAAVLAATVGLSALASDARGAALLLDPSVRARDEAGRAAVVVAARYLRPWAAGLDPARALPGGLPGERLAGEGRAGWVLSPTLGPLLLALATAAAVAAATAGRGPRARAAGATALAALLALELLDRGVLWNPTAPAGAVFPTTPTLRRLADLTGDGRALADAGCHPNGLAAAGVRGLGAYHPLRPTRAALLLGRLSGERPRSHVVTARALPAAWRDALAVRAVVTARGAAPTVPGGLAADPAVEPDAGAALWTNPGALPRARLHPPEAVVAAADRDAALEAVVAAGFDPRRHVVLEPPAAGHAPDARRDPDPAAPPPAPAAILEDGPDRVVVAVDAPRGGVLVLADAVAAGWTASAAGRPLPLAPADVALRGVPLPAGFAGPVTFAYARPGAALGRGLAALGAALAALVAWRGGSARRDPLYFAPP